MNNVVFPPKKFKLLLFITELRRVLVISFPGTLYLSDYTQIMMHPSILSSIDYPRRLSPSSVWAASAPGPPNLSAVRGLEILF